MFIFTWIAVGLGEIECARELVRDHVLARHQQALDLDVLDNAVRKAGRDKDDVHDNLDRVLLQELFIYSKCAFSQSIDRPTEDWYRVQDEVQLEKLRKDKDDEVHEQAACVVGRRGLGRRVLTRGRVEHLCVWW